MKTILNEMNVKMPAKSENESLARSILSAFAAPMNPTVEELGDVRCALSEAVTNCIVHAYRDRSPEEPGYIFLSFRHDADGVLEMEITDFGCGIADVEEARHPSYTSTEGEERCGMGFLVMESFTDGITVRSEVGKGTTVTLCKILSEARNADGDRETLNGNAG